MADPAPPLAGIELGGTKTIAVLGRGRAIAKRVSVPTRQPAETLDAVAATLVGWRRAHGIAALGIAAFGPVAIDPALPDFGRLLTTPKSGWAGADVVGPLAAAAGTGRVRLHTDVTAAALAEGRWGGAQGLADYIYATIGTGIGTGIVAGGRPIAGRLHPEAGHVRVRRLAGDAFPGTCPYHGDCLEGLASGPAVAARAGAPAATLAPDDPAWAPVADAIAEGLAGLFATLAPAAILIGGGLGLGQPHLLPRVRDGVAAKLAGYLPYLPDRAAVAAAIRPAALGGEAGPLGALALAALAEAG